MEHWLEPVFKSATEGAVLVGTSRSRARVAACARRHRGVRLRNGPGLLDVHRQEGRAGRAAEQAGPGPLPAPARQVARRRALRHDGHRGGRLARRDERRGRQGHRRRHPRAADVARGGRRRARSCATFQNGVVHVVRRAHGRRHRGDGVVLRVRRTPRPPSPTRAATTTWSRRRRASATRTGGTPTATASRTSPTSPRARRSSCTCEPGQTTMVNLEVKNAFGLVRSQEASSVARPQAPTSSL